MGIYGTYVHRLMEAQSLNESAWKINGKSSYIDRVKRDKSKIEKEVNRISKEIFQSFCDSLKDGSYEEDAEEFRKGKPPVVNSFEMNTDYIEIQLKYFSGWNDTQLFFQDYLIKKLNSDTKLRSLGYHFSGEDYLAIYIHLRKDSMSESQSIEDILPDDGSEDKKQNYEDILPDNGSEDNSRNDTGFKDIRRPVRIM